MDFIKKFFVEKKTDFQKGGRLEKYKTYFNGFYTFLFGADEYTHNKGCHIKDAIDLKRTMFFVVIALVPLLLFGMWNVGYQHFLATQNISGSFIDCFLYGSIKVLPLVVVSYVVGLGIEFVIAAKKGHEINEGFLVSGILIPLILPIETPIWMVALATAFAVIIGKEIFGGTGMNILNVALTARAFLFFAYPTDLSGDKVWISLAEGVNTIDGYTGATILGQAINNVDTFIAVNGNPYENLLNSAFIGSIPGSIGETSTLLCLLGGVFLMFTGVASWRIILSAFVGGFIMTTIFNTFAVNKYMELSPLLQMSLGGFAFGIIFMATDPVTAAQTNTGKYIYGFFAGFFSILIRVFNPAYPEGVMLAILFMNIMAPLIDHYVIEANINKRLKRIKTT